MDCTRYLAELLLSAYKKGILFFGVDISKK